MREVNNMRINKNIKIRIAGIIAVSLLMLTFTPLAAMAEKAPETDAAVNTETVTEEEINDGNTLISEDEESETLKTATPSNAEEIEVKTATPSNAESVTDEIELENDLEQAEDGEIAEDTAITAEELAGTWTVDGTTSYLFEEDGQGALLLPENSYPFSYTIEAEELILQFENSAIGTAVFVPTITEDSLILKRNQETGDSEFQLEREEMIIIE